METLEIEKIELPDEKHVFEEVEKAVEKKPANMVVRIKDPIKINVKHASDTAKLVMKKVVIVLEPKRFNSKRDKLKEAELELAKEKNIQTPAGVYVNNVIELSAAAVAGIKEGDIITKINSTQVKTVSELQEQIGRYRPGDEVTIKIIRNNETKSLTVKLKNKQGTTDIIKKEGDIQTLGATFKEVSKETAQQLGITHGLQIKTISNGKLQDAGVKKDYIILKVNNRTIRTENDLKDVFNKAVTGDTKEKVLFIAGAYPNGKIAYYAVNLTE